MAEYLLQSGVGEIAGQHYLPSHVDELDEAARLVGGAR
jgi:hypothetical protein